MENASGLINRGEASAEAGTPGVQGGQPASLPDVLTASVARTDRETGSSVCHFASQVQLRNSGTRGYGGNIEGPWPGGAHQVKARISRKIE